MPGNNPMRRPIVKRTLLTAMLLAASAASAQIARDIPPAVRMSTRVAGMGGVSVATTEDENALFYNPAGLRLMGRSRWSLINGYLNLGDGAKDISDIKEDFENADANNDDELSMQELVETIEKHIPTNLRVGVTAFPYYATPDWAVGLAGEGNVRVEILDPDLPRVEVSGYVDTIVAGSYARSLMDNLHLGITLKSVNRTILRGIKHTTAPVGCTRAFDTTDPFGRDIVVIDSDDLLACDEFEADNYLETGAKANGFGVDVGALFVLSDAWRFGLVLRDVAGTSLSGDLDPTVAGDEKREIPFSAALGAAHWRPELWSFQDVTLAADIAPIGRGGNLFRNLHLGFEGSLPWLGYKLRLGLNQGYLTVGHNFQLGPLQLEYAFYQEEFGFKLGDDADARHLLSMTLRF